MLLVIEGLDGAGKLTQSRLLAQKLERLGRRVGFLSFPRLGETAFSKAIIEYLNGRLGDLDAISPYFSSILFAGDRFESRETLQRLLESCEFVLCDRYVSSNLAYQSARVPPASRDEFVAWLSHIEYVVFGLPKPDVTVFLDVPVTTAAALVEKKGARDYTDAPADLHERDLSYLAECRKVYHGLAAKHPDSPWIAIDCVDDRGTIRPQAEITELIWEGLRTGAPEFASRARS